MASKHDVEEFVDEAIEKNDDFHVLNLLLDIKLHISKTLDNSTKIHFKPTFELHRTVSNSDLISDVLIKASNVCDDFSYILTYIIKYIRCNHENAQCQSSIVNLLNFLISCAGSGKIDNLCEYLEADLISSFLIKALDNVHTKSKAYQALSQVIEEFSVADQARCLSAIFDCCVQNNNLEIFCALLKHVSNDAICAEISCFNKDNFCLYVESCISGSESHLQKQGQFMLSKCIDTLSNRHASKYLLEASVLERSWQAFFVLIDVGREKQLHLVEPSLSLFKSIESLPFLWQKCVYKIYLEHSQVSIVYKVAIEILNKTYTEDNLREVAKLVFPAINKNEYSDLSCEMFQTLRQFCEKLSENELVVICEELIQISWIAVSFWKVLQSVYIIENKAKMDISLFQKIITPAMTLPHIYIRTECVKYLISVFWNENDYNTIFTIMYSVKQLEPTTDLKYFKSCNISKDIVVDSVVDDLFKFNNGCDDLHKTKICITILNTLKVYVHKPLHSLAPDVLLLVWVNLLSFHPNPELLYAQVEVFLVKYFKYYLFRGTTAFYLELFKLLHSKRKVSEDTFLRVVDEPIFNSNDYNNSQIYVSLSLLQECIKCGYLDPIVGVKESSDQIIISFSKKDGSTTSDIEVDDSRFFKVCFDLFIENRFDTSEAMKILATTLNTQSNEVLHDIYTQLYRLIKASNSPKFVRECIRISHETLKELKKDHYFKGIVIGFINAVYSEVYFSLEADSMDIELINTDLLEFSESYPVVRCEWIQLLYNLCDRDLHHDICMKIIVDLYLQEMVVTKDYRNEYNVCQEFISNPRPDADFWLRENIPNPNCAKAVAKIDSMFRLRQLREQYLGAIISYLIERYRRHCKIRYFPDSVTHYTKLRILQALLYVMPVPKTDTKKEHAEKISSFVFDCFENETNQNCIRQLLNYILIAALKDVSPVFKWIESKPAGTSSALFINVTPTIYHLAKDYGTEETLEKIIKMVLPWTMGPQFKLRVYAQDLTKRIIDLARKKNYNDFLRRYEHLENGIKSCLESAGDVVVNTMKSDIPFLNDLLPNRDFHEKTIFYDIPRLNRVYHAEWQNQGTFHTHNKLFASAVDRFLNDTESTTEPSKSEAGHAHHIQKKVTPWKSALENMGADVNDDFILVASLVDKAQNLGGLSRTCEVLGIRNIAFHNAKIVDDKEFRSLSMSSEGWINAVEVKALGLREFILKLQDDGYVVVGAEQTGGSRQLTRFQFPRKVALILGNEKTGIPADIIPLLDVCLEIPQIGQTRSLNVHVAGAMFVWEYAKQHLI